jgi:hypothetical protein
MMKNTECEMTRHASNGCRVFLSHTYNGTLFRCVKNFTTEQRSVVLNCKGQSPYLSADRL